jgi:hypothetical protein
VQTAYIGFYCCGKEDLIKMNIILIMKAGSLRFYALFYKKTILFLSLDILLIQDNKKKYIIKKMLD